MKRIILFPLLLVFTFGQSEQEVEYVMIQGEHTQKINQSIDAVRVECTELAIINAINGYILNDENSEKNIKKINNCLRSKLVEISVVNESVIQTNFTITIQAFILEESISECL